MILAAGLALVLSRGAAADTLFQSSPLLPTDTPEAFTPEPPPEASEPLPEAPEPPADLPAPPPEAPTVEPEPPQPTAEAAGFLPAPTLTNPDELLSGGILPQAQPPLSGAAAPVEAAGPTPTAEPPAAAQLIDGAVMLLGYAWLRCGAALLALAAVTFVWIMRRSARRRPRI